MENGINTPGEQPQTPAEEQSTDPAPEPAAVPAPSSAPVAEPQASAPATPCPSLVFPIIATVLCWPIGLFAILKTVAARKAADSFDTAAATKNAGTAKTLSIVATCFGALGWVLSVMVLIISVNLAASTYDFGDSDEEAPVYSDSLADGPTKEITFKLTVAQGTAVHEFSGTLGGTEFENSNHADSEFEKSFTKTVLVDRNSTDFSVDVFTDTSGVKVSCEIEVDGKLDAKNSSEDSTYCYLGMGVESDEAETKTDTEKDSALSKALTPPTYTIGDCINTITTENLGTSSEKVDCAEPHDGQVTHVETLPRGDYPGDEAVSAQANTVCIGDSFTTFVGIPFTDTQLSVAFLYPNRLSWLTGSHDITCLVNEGEGKTTGSLQGAAR
ncbi:hypothetical protein G7066_00880 [Leucobacter coleopterorum]|uniref:Septum formation-related domain-containing protein n=1 Tax=Leucobacter coleopterorum TaxID=2714933 RepID=A0ABX6JTK9_9MICO|nr:CD225/dispanin family protein [Leucobacter coleopterorum]QIM17623.1 hypothetical protein G7066_00880 [Leucobacter coleopterorum]